jgi:acyl-CoA thioesterase-1
MDMKRFRPPRTIISANGTRLAGVTLCCLTVAACRGGTRPEPSPTVTASASPVARVPADDRPVLLFVGTSLTAGLGVDPSEAYPALVQRKIDVAGLHYRVVNAGVSGETSAGARRRMGWLMRQPVAVLVVETGANDGLRGQPPEATRENVQAIFDEARRQHPPPKLVLSAMEALPNYGEDYRRRFRAIFPELAKANGAALVPFLLDGVAGDPRLNQPDGIHPTAEGHERVAENVWRFLRPLLAPAPQALSFRGTTVGPVPRNPPAPAIADPSGDGRTAPSG